MAVYKDGIKPFPHTTVTDTATPYPQNIAFRFGMMTAASFLALVFFCIARWMKYVQVKSNYPGNIPNTLYIVSEMAILPYCLTIGTIDSGKTGKIHDVSAVVFFVLLFSLTLVMTYLLWKMRNWDASIMSAESWFMKRLTCFYILAVWIYCIYGISFGDHKKHNDFVVIVEWNTVVVNLLWLLSFRREWKKVYLTFNSKGTGDLL